jgi:hypothetical protein
VSKYPATLDAEERAELGRPVSVGQGAARLFAKGWGRDRAGVADLHRPGPMLDQLRGQASPPELRPFAVACCRRVGHRPTHLRARRAVEVAERAVQRLCPSSRASASRCRTFSSSCSFQGIPSAFMSSRAFARQLLASWV